MVKPIIGPHIQFGRW